MATAARPAAALAGAILSLIATAASAADRPATPPKPLPVAVANAPAASGETRDIVQTAFFQALSAPSSSAAGGAH